MNKNFGKLDSFNFQVGSFEENLEISNNILKPFLIFIFLDIQGIRELQLSLLEDQEMKTLS